MLHVLLVDQGYEPLVSIEGHSAAVLAASFVELEVGGAGGDRALFVVSCGADRLIVFHRLTLQPAGYARTHCIVAPVAVLDVQLNARRRRLFAACQDRLVRCPATWFFIFCFIQQPLFRVYDLADAKLKKCFKASTADDGNLLKVIFVSVFCF